MMTPLDPLPNLIDQVYERILAGITDRTLPPGHRIRQNELAELLGVSRQPVSHALHLLHRQGLVAESGRKGFEVTRLDPRRIRQLYEVRGAIDALAARLAAGRAETDAAGRAQLEAALLAGTIDRRTDASRGFDRARRRFSPRDLSARRQSRDRGNDHAAMAAYAAFDGDGAGRTGLSHQRLGRTRDHRGARFSPATQHPPRAARIGACDRRRTNDRRPTEARGRSGVAEIASFERCQVHASNAGLGTTSRPKQKSQRRKRP